MTWKALEVLIHNTAGEVLLFTANLSINTSPLVIHELIYFCGGAWVVGVAVSLVK